MVTLTYTIQDENLAEFKAGFLIKNPNPPDSGLTDNQWIKKWGLRQFVDAYAMGKRMLAKNAASIENSLIE